MGRQRPDLPQKGVTEIPGGGVPENRCYRTHDPIALAREIETDLDTLWELAV
jgi:hypothetical protein